MTREQKLAAAKLLREEGLSYRAIAGRVGFSATHVRRILNPGADTDRTVRIPVEPFVERYRELHEDGLTDSTLCERLGYTWDGRADITRFKRHLGLKPWRNGQGGCKRNEKVNPDIALRLCTALELDPVDVGL